MLDDDATSSARAPPGRCRRRRAGSARAPSRSTRRSRAASSGRARAPCGSTSTSLRATASVELGRVQAHDLELALDGRVVEPQVEAAALQRLGQLARVVRGEQHERLRASPRPRPARGSRSGSRRAPRAASPRTPGRSCRSRRSAARPAPRRRSPSAAAGRAGTPRRRCRPGPPASRCRRPRSGCAAAACGSSTRTAPWPRRGPRSTGAGSACARSRARRAFASSVLPTPAGPSTSTGLPSRPARNDTSAADSSAR